MVEWEERMMKGMKEKNRIKGRDVKERKKNERKDRKMDRREEK